MEIELRHLRRVVAIAEAGGVAGAAVALEVSEQALTIQLERIEGRVAEPLFIRSGTLWMPTARGRDILESARAALVEMAQLVAECHRAGKVTLSIVGPEAMVVPVAARFAAARTDIVVSIRVVDAHTAVDAVRRGTADVAVTERWPQVELPGNPSPGSADVQTYEVDRIPVHVLLPDTHRFAGHDLLDLADLAGETWCVLAAPAHARVMVAECVRHGFEPKVGYQLDTDGAIVDKVASGEAVALVAYLAQTRPGTVARPYRDPAQIALVLTWRPDVVPPDLGRDLVGAIEGWYATRAWARPAAVDGAPGSASCPLRIGSVAELNAIPVVPRLRTVHGLYAEICFGTQRELLAAIGRGELDLVLCQSLALQPDDLPPGWSRRVVVSDEPVTVVLGTGHRLATAAVPLAALADEAWAVRTASGEAEMLHALGAAAGFEPRIASAYTDPRQILAAVASGRLVRVADPASIEEGAVRRRIDHPAARRTLVLVWPPDSRAAPMADVVAEELRLSRAPYVAPVLPDRR